MDDFYKRFSDVVGEDHAIKTRKEGQIAVQLRRERKKRNLSQQELADLARLPKSTIGRIEAGLTSPKTDTLAQLAKTLNTSFTIGKASEDDKNLYIKS
ncbi:MULTISPECIES: helix-turn-helix domain-containing protein [Sporosarcina]|uniref:helix-turn-helix domain-containing protein n=1 Tax=Sporosarcina TaxID=1569 RepID=UPI00129B027F|nr:MULTISPECIES: helix-turn-helix transcriptional regulator [Sporosarcina]GKV64823.1 hypothetical protein NCCP2331_09760 [Sporosarcina sp. NCCP-2331]GLB54933.1 hypothetical protein NCCP2378_07180 [Sporosarcina sp. NCCP-2378]